VYGVGVWASDRFSWDILIPAGVGLLVVLLVVVWPVVSDMPIHDGFFRRVRVLHVTCIIYIYSWRVNSMIRGTLNG
jgi:hypothetical protein